MNNILLKKRYPISPRVSLTKSNTTSIFIKKKILFEGVYYSAIRRDLRKVLKKGGLNKIWIFLKANYPISKKSKNSRMGKGVGAFLRWGFQLCPNHTLLKFFKVHHTKVRRVRTSLQNIVGTPVYIQSTNKFN